MWVWLGVENKRIGRASQRLASRRHVNTCYRNDALRRTAAPDKDAGSTEKKLKESKAFSHCVEV
jgi:hypothetical protein